MKVEINNSESLSFSLIGMNSSEWELFHFELEHCVKHSQFLKKMDLDKLTNSIMENSEKLNELVLLTPDQFSPECVEQLSNPELPKILMEIAEIRLKTINTILNKKVESNGIYYIEHLTDSEISILYGVISERIPIYFTLVNNPDGNEGVDILREVNKELFEGKDMYENHPLLKEFVGTVGYRDKKFEVLELMMTTCYSWEKEIAEALSKLYEE